MANHVRNNSGSSATATRPRAGRQVVAPNKPAEVKAIEKPGRAITHEAIAARAYELWKIRGGDAELNWLEAEQQLRSGM